MEFRGWTASRRRGRRVLVVPRDGLRTIIKHNPPLIERPDRVHQVGRRSGRDLQGGRGPLSWAHLTARLQGEVERSLADEAAGPLAQILSIPQDGGDDGEDDPLAKLKGDLASARGRAMLLETTSSAWGEGRSAAPQSDWKQSRLGPQPPAALVAVADAAFSRTLAACGVPPSLFLDSDGTSQREGWRR